MLRRRHKQAIATSVCILVTIQCVLLRQTPATVVVIFIVDENGRVQDPKVQRTTNTAFDRSALAAIRQWKFEPAKAQGRAVSSRLRQSFSFENNN